ncbi:phosphate acetyltransferase [Mangrovicella endophytica]|uniref:phosphate acetyltransferase n=1 Tax=Mangrovicella endophytica TaxID=2066697 RepID=UPI000C9E0EC3|nr:phosphate acetyltransferase [Mangrovicella endophytica]
MDALDRLIDAARARPRHIVLPEGEDARIVEGAVRAAGSGIATITLLGDGERVRSRLRCHGRAADAVAVEDPRNSPLLPALASAYLSRRRDKGMDEETALAHVGEPLGFAAMMVREGHADGTLGGAVATTSDTVRAALRMIGRAPGVAVVSSFFLMTLNQPHHIKKGTFVFADCGLVIDPNAEELAAIAVSSARSFAELTSEQPKVAMLSFSTQGSAKHQNVDKVVEATRLARLADPDLLIEGEMQFDAAFISSVAEAKHPTSVLKGEANVFIFPNLDAANIGYKVAQRIGGAQALGPILQGLARPANDLSRGCSADDVYNMIAITVLQGAGH